MVKAVMLSLLFPGIFILTTSFFQKYDLPKSIARGKEVYTTYCMNCHIADGKGTLVFPPLAKADYLKKPVKTLINIILQGQNGEIMVNAKKYNVLMPAQGYLNDDQVADVLNYVRNTWGNKTPIAVTPVQVKALRD